MRKEKVWLIVHPDEERFFVQPRPVLASRAEMLRQQGYMILVTEVSLPPILDRVVEPIEVQSTPAKEQWGYHDVSDTPHAELEVPVEQGADPGDPVTTGVLVRPDSAPEKQEALTSSEQG